MATATMTAGLQLRFKDHDVRFVGTPDRPEWVATDVGEVLGVQNVRQVVAKLPADEKGVCTTYTSTGNKEVATVYEAGLYRLILKSRKPEAKEFQRWVFGEVLPSIRKFGIYPPPAEVPTPTIDAPAVATALRPLILDMVREAVAAHRDQLAPRLPGTYWTVERRLVERFPDWRTTSDQRAAIRKRANDNIRQALPGHAIEYMHGPCIYRSEMIEILDRSIEYEYRKAVQKDEVDSWGLFDPHLYPVDPRKPR